MGALAYVSSTDLSSLCSFARPPYVASTSGSAVRRLLLGACTLALAVRYSPIRALCAILRSACLSYQVTCILSAAPGRSQVRRHLKPGLPKEPQRGTIVDCIHAACEHRLSRIAAKAVAPRNKHDGGPQRGAHQVAHVSPSRGRVGAARRAPTPRASQHVSCPSPPL